MRRLVKHTAIMISILMMIMMSWESQKTDAAVGGGPIPEQSIRLRILANSDSAGDQLVKRQIRDRVVEQMNGWVAKLENPQSLDQARAVIREHLPELEKLVGQELDKRGLSYGYKVELGVVPFPTKLYGGTVYPAGNYEALRITLGAGDGQNWWCVLFPPLCFIDAGTGDAAAKPADEAKVAQTSAKSEKSKNGGVSKDSASAAGQQKGGSAVNGDAAGDTGQSGSGAVAQPKVRFFIWDFLKSIISWFRSLIA
ncbi:stage II sporulation protein R [Paenibacillus sp. HN-1]|uniref:stage II sporulation protein R n=1 Tax=Paenibacillus TaxID=44249 RepID=UPI001CA8F558|nr:stage II sporulation protein R [Paenibacillus sp. CGMCC 1.18879]MBY9087416.1 stage II sporulation protein R [Paenibacillus sinensis]